jgi:hypothetical protein
MRHFAWNLSNKSFQSILIYIDMNSYEGDQVSKLDLPVVSMASFAALFNTAFVIRNTNEFRLLYENVKVYMLQEESILIPSSSQVILTTLLGPLKNLTEELRTELVSVFILLFSSSRVRAGQSKFDTVAREIYQAWIAEFGNYPQESEILMTYLIKYAKSSSSKTWKKVN